LLAHAQTPFDGIAAAAAEDEEEANDPARLKNCDEFE
jgi:hypothetical protein